MPNSYTEATRWLQLISAQSLPQREIFMQHIDACAISSFCTCGCHSFEVSIAEDVVLTPLQSGSGIYCELAFESNLPEEVDILLFTDARGYFSGADVTYGFANVEPMPEGVEVTHCKGIWRSGAHA